MISLSQLIKTEADHRTNENFTYNLRYVLKVRIPQNDEESDSMSTTSPPSSPEPTYASILLIGQDETRGSIVLYGLTNCFGALEI